MFALNLKLNEMGRSKREGEWFLLFEEDLKEHKKQKQELDFMVFMKERQPDEKLDKVLTEFFQGMENGKR